MNAPPAARVGKSSDGELHATWLERFGSGFQADILAVLRNKFPDSFSKIAIEYVNKISRIKDLLDEYFYFKEVEFIEVLGRAEPSVIIQYWKIIMEGDKLKAANALANLLYKSNCSLAKVQLANRIVLGVIPMAVERPLSVVSGVRARVCTVTPPDSEAAVVSLRRN